MSILYDLKYFITQLKPLWSGSEKYTFDWNAEKITCRPDLTVGTYNVNYGLSSYVSARDKVVCALKQMDTDFILLQEVNKEWTEVLRHGVGNLYPHMVFCETGMESSGMGIIGKYPFDSRVVDTNKAVEGSCFQTLIATTTVKDVTLCLVNVHLRPPVNPTASLTSPSGTDAFRLNEVRYITSHLDLSLPTVIAGDFNEQEAAPASILLSKTFSASSGSLIPTCKETHRWPFAGTVLMKRLDHILGRNIAMKTAGVITGFENVSDHQPVVAAFIFDRAE
eukprot:TRINITY_DN337_c0_g6_i1.p1 TRINITY_DN337_c0_g6~~TRINITY_DN337_c0_g6_i1.p1  ORF type:complete len:279 (+),score=36.14 TRINITY_DN337_c0_g6_i1:51-887(+)